MVVTSQAKQLDFSKKKNKKVYRFNYTWLDHQATEQSMSFELPKKSLFSKFRNFRIYKSEMATQSLTKTLKKQLQKKPLAGVKVRFVNENGTENISILGPQQKDVNHAYQQIATMQKDIEKAYLTKNYYHQFITHDNINAIKPNHVRFANESAEDLKPLKPLILEKVSIQNIRRVTNFALAFIQSIPYSTLESRIDSSGTGFNPPLKVLWENQGDCDSKVTLTAALLRSLMPRLNMALVFIDNHALIGLVIPPIGDEITVSLDGLTYVLAEPTGPALLPLGKLAENSKQAVLQGRYSIEKFHYIKKIKPVKQASPDK